MSIRPVLVLVLGLFTMPALADKVPVDLELAFVVDNSGSIDDDEVRLQRQGYADALAHPKVLNAIASGYLRKIAVAYIEFAALDCNQLSVAWAVIDGAAAAKAFGRKVVGLERWYCPGGNAVADALAFAAQSIETNGFEGTRRVIDISGDGPNTLGGTLTEIRDAVNTLGSTINGLVIDRPDIPDLFEYFTRYVIGGQGAFAIKADDRRTFAKAIFKKLLAEIAGRPPSLRTAGRN